MDFLIKNFGLPRSQIFDSHSNSFLPSVLEATGGRGVDVALNSLAGEYLHDTWKSIAPFGTMIGEYRRYGRRNAPPLTALSRNRQARLLWSCKIGHDAIYRKQNVHRS